MNHKKKLKKIQIANQASYRLEFDKYGTQKRDDRKTEGLFRKHSNVSFANKINVCNLETVGLNI
ncbi:hypothetical protein KAS41_03525 [Candidatus Parcubacteria bacterium]|nr:hypothetical protein [Candidatus Parcubacteria bacterium]